MALILKPNLDEASNRLGAIFSEATGIYDATSKLGGYGTPNPTVDSASYTKLTIQKYGSDDVYNISPLSGFPSNVSTTELLIPYTLFGGAVDEKIVDGIYLVTYTVYTTPTTVEVILASDSFYVAFTGGIACCLSAIRTELPVPTKSCGCADKKKNHCICNFAIVEADYRSICSLIECGKIDKAQEVIDFLINYCSENCKTCS